MIAAEDFLAMTKPAPTATATASAGAVSWSLASPTATGAATAPTATPPPRTSSAAIVIVVPGSGMDVVQRYEYTGRELASQSGEYFFRYRVYGPSLGQFFTRDPLGYVDGMGLYTGWSSLLLERDPFGRESEAWAWTPSDLYHFDLACKKKRADASFARASAAGQAALPAREVEPCNRKIVAAIGIAAKALRKTPACNEAFAKTKHCKNIEDTIKKFEGHVQGVFGRDKRCYSAGVTCCYMENKEKKYFDLEGIFSVKAFTYSDNHKWDLYICATSCDDKTSDVASTIIHELFHECDDNMSGEAGALAAQAACK